MSRLCVCLTVFFLLLPVAAFGALTGLQPITAEATGPDGASVGFTVQVEGGNDGSDGRPADTVACTPSSGSIFPIGTTTVSCTGSEGSTGTLLVTVVDTTAPALSLPLDFTVVTTSPSGEPVTYTASAFDLVDGSVPISCTPPSGSTFALGTTTVTCTASDTRGNTASGEFDITLATEPPPPGNPDLIAEATGPDGAPVTFDTGDTDDGDGRPGSGGCSPAPGSTFPLGETIVTCPSGNFTISVVDTTPPALSLPADITATATGPSGAEVTFTATASDLVDGSVAVTCNPPSGSTFSLGVTTVSCSATDAHDNTATGSFQIEVTSDPVPPTNPDDITAEATGPGGAIVTFTVGTDGGGRPITCTPAPGSTFALGDTEVTCSDGTTFTVTVVDTTPPVLTLPADMTVEATSAAGAAVTFTATAQDLVDGAVNVLCTPSSGSTFALGATAVSCSATDAHENTASGSFSVTVVDTTPPVLTLPADMTVEATSAAGAAVTFTATAEDLVDGAVSVTCTPPSGSTFALGTTSVSCSASDAHENTASESFSVNVVDTTAPVLTLPADLTVEATSAAGAVATFTATAEDLVDGAVSVTCTPPSGSTFALGTTSVSCSATDAHGNTGTGSFSVTVVDTTPPVLTLPADLTVEATSAAGAVATFTATAEDLVDGAVSVTCTPPSGSTFALGTTSVSCSATDAHDNTGTGSFSVTVVDTTLPVITSVTASPTSIWPPNKKMVNVTVTVAAEDLVDPAPLIRIFDITCDEPIDSSDAVITGLLTAKLRAERLGSGDGRVYTLHIEVIDAAGNRSTATVDVTVPHNQGGNNTTIQEPARRRSVRG